MRYFYSLLAVVVLAVALTAPIQAAFTKISDLPAITSPSTNTWIEVADMAAATKSRKYLLTNLATVAQVPTLPTNMVVSTGASTAGALATYTGMDGTNTAPSSFTVTNLLRAIYPFNIPTRLVFDGDSLTSGNGVTLNYGYPTYLSNYFAIYNVFDATNAAVSGQKASDLLSQYATNISPLKPTAGTQAVYFVWAGLNDLAVDSPATTFGNLSNLWRLAKTDGFTVVAFTTTSRTNSETYSPALETVEAQLNSSIRAATNWDYLVDTAQFLPTPYGTTTDGIHFTTNVNYYIAEKVFDTILKPEGTLSSASVATNLDGLVLNANGSYYLYKSLVLPSPSSVTANGMSSAQFQVTGTYLTIANYGIAVDPTMLYGWRGTVGGALDTRLDRAAANTVKITSDSGTTYGTLRANIEGTTGVFTNSVTTPIVYFGTNILSYSGTNLTWNGVAITVP